MLRVDHTVEPSVRTEQDRVVSHGKYLTAINILSHMRIISPFHRQKLGDAVITVALISFALAHIIDQLFLMFIRDPDQREIVTAVLAVLEALRNQDMIMVHFELDYKAPLTRVGGAFFLVQDHV